MFVVLALVPVTIVYSFSVTEELAISLTSNAILGDPDLFLLEDLLYFEHLFNVDTFGPDKGRFLHVTNTWDAGIAWKFSPGSMASALNLCLQQL